jgi:hypothetical protein
MNCFHSLWNTAGKLNGRHSWSVFTCEEKNVLTWVRHLPSCLYWVTSLSYPGWFIFHVCYVKCFILGTVNFWKHVCLHNKFFMCCNSFSRNNYKMQSMGLICPVFRMNWISINENTRMLSSSISEWSIVYQPRWVSLHCQGMPFMPLHKIWVFPFHFLDRHCISGLTTSVMQIICWEATIYSASQEITHLLWNLKVIIMFARAWH